MRDEVFVTVFVTAEKGYLSTVALVVENRNVGDDLIDAFSCQLVRFLGLYLKDGPLLLGREDHRMPGKHMQSVFSLQLFNFLQVKVTTHIKIFQKGKNALFGLLLMQNHM